MRRLLKIAQLIDSSRLKIPDCLIWKPGNDGRMILAEGMSPIPASVYTEADIILNINIVAIESGDPKTMFCLK